MAKTTETKKEAKIVTIADLATKYNVEGREIRLLLRSNGMKAPAVEVPAGGFGPRSKYQWEEGSKELAAVEKIIVDSIDETPDEAQDEAPEADEKPAEEKPAKTSKGKGKKA
jgi:hypothetical protein